MKKFLNCKDCGCGTDLPLGPSRALNHQKLWSLQPRFWPHIIETQQIAKPAVKYAEIKKRTTVTIVTTVVDLSCNELHFYWHVLNMCHSWQYLQWQKVIKRWCLAVLRACSLQKFGYSRHLRCENITAVTSHLHPTASTVIYCLCRLCLDDIQTDRYIVAFSPCKTHLIDWNRLDTFAENLSQLSRLSTLSDRRMTFGSPQPAKRWRFGLFEDRWGLLRHNSSSLPQALCQPELLKSWSCCSNVQCYAIYVLNLKWYFQKKNASNWNIKFHHTSLPRSESGLVLSRHNPTSAPSQSFCNGCHSLSPQLHNWESDII